MSRLQRTLFVCLVAAGLSLPADGQERRQRPFNRIVILIDRSASFAGNLPAASALAERYIRDEVNTSPNDAIYLIAVDRDPTVLAYARGSQSVRQVGKTFDEAFATVSADSGTDWAGALKKALQTLDNPPEPTSKHLLVFGDLRVDPAKDSGRTVKRFAPLSSMDWGEYSGVKSAFYFVDETVRASLNEDPGFRTLGATVFGIESALEARHVERPRPARNAPTPEGARQRGASGAVALGVGLVGLVCLYAWSLAIRRRWEAEARS